MRKSRFTEEQMVAIVRAADKEGAAGVGPSLPDKVAHLSLAGSYRHAPETVAVKETHMSWVFLASGLVYKLKKPVWFPYLDFSTLEKREAACRAEVALNRRLAPDVYLGVVPLVATPGGLSIGGDGTVVDWLVVMRRLDDRWGLERAILEHRLTRTRLDRLVEKLAAFYRRARPVLPNPQSHLSELRQDLATNRRVLLNPRLGLPQQAVLFVDRAQRLFLANNAGMLLRRAMEGRIVDAHGDLRPEHIWINDDVLIIDCLEFNARLRSVDPIDEIAFLTLECERLGAAWAGSYIRRGIERRLRDDVPPELFHFYRCHRATLRARLAIAHLLEPDPRTPEKWPRNARAYLGIAERDARAVLRILRRRRGRKASAPHEDGGSSRRTRGRKV